MIRGGRRGGKGSCLAAHQLSAAQNALQVRPRHWGVCISAVGFCGLLGSLLNSFAPFMAGGLYLETDGGEWSGVRGHIEHLILHRVGSSLSKAQLSLPTITQEQCLRSRSKQGSNPRQVIQSLRACFLSCKKWMLMILYRL